MKLTHTIPFKRFLLSLAVVGFVDLLLLLLAALKGTPYIGGILYVNLWILAIFLLRLGISLLTRLRCPRCRQSFGRFTDSEIDGFPEAKCPRCGAVWLV